RRGAVTRTRMAARRQSADRELGTGGGEKDARLDGLELQAFVQTAEPVPLEVDRYELEAVRTERPIDPIGHRRLDRARKLVATQLDARHFAVMSYAEHPEPQRSKRLFAGF